MKQTPSEKLAALTKKWYEKLRKEGFEDAERNETELYKYSQNAYRTYSKKDLDQAGTSIAAKEEYYTMSEHFLNEHKFKNPMERYIWEQHTQGYGGRKISAKLKAKKSKHLTFSSKSHIDRIIAELEKVMLEKYKVSRG